ncbi:phosphatidylinositol-specific phospholipase C [Streptomyces sp. NPDC057445]|uniref:phosphatidylinositol-specific phospholipase C n=1 Tax=Streptomyces sp. NPDC057445 TaxID=3346136 RepID=UPI003699207B
MSLSRRGFLTGAALVSATALIGASPAAASTRRVLGTQDWMSGIDGSRALASLTIPGTHDSGARFGGLWAECQNTTIAQQLDSGIRFLDVRCRVTGGSFAIHHGAAYQNMMFGDVLIACRDFLGAHPSETVLMRVKQEYSGDSDATFRGIFDNYLDARGWRPLFHIGEALPTLGQARGKVVLVADNGGLPGVKWWDGNVFDIQDDWNAAPGAKYPKIEGHFGKAVQQPGRLFINFVSTSAYLPPRWNSDNLNPRVHGFLDGTASSWKGLGIVPMDFPNTRSGLVDSLIRHN